MVKNKNLHIFFIGAANSIRFAYGAECPASPTSVVCNAKEIILKGVSHEISRVLF